MLLPVPHSPERKPGLYLSGGNVQGLCLYPHSVELQHSIAFIHEEQMPLSGMDPLISCLAMLLRFVPVV